MVLIWALDFVNLQTINAIMKKALFVLVLLPATIWGQEKVKSFKLSGSIKNINPQVDWVYINYSVNGESKKDSVHPADGKYVFKGQIAEPVMAQLRVKYVSTDPAKKQVITRKDYAIIFLQSGKIKLSSTDSFSNIKVKGSKANAEYVKLNQSGKPFDDRMEPLYKKYSEYAKAKDKENMQKTEDEIDAIDKEKTEKVYADYVRTNPHSPLAVYALKQYAGWNIDAGKVEPLFNSLPASVKLQPSAVSLKEQIEIAKKTGIGKYAMDFTQNDTMDVPVTMSTFRGKYLLIDFWASWCGPCRQENPNVVAAFNKFKDRNFHILSVSLDRPGQKEKWLKAIHDDHLEWTHVSDLQFWDNAVAKEYGIRAIPQNLLLDPDGKIIAKNLRGEDLDEKLQQIIVEKKAF